MNCGRGFVILARFAWNSIMIVLYGIKNCDAVKKARRWLDVHQLTYRFHDLRVDGISEPQILHWFQTLGVEKLINKRSATWKQLSDDERARVLAGDADLVRQHPTLIKRPLLDTGRDLYTGFSENEYSQRLKA